MLAKTEESFGAVGTVPAVPGVPSEAVDVRVDKWSAPVLNEENRLAGHVCHQHARQRDAGQCRGQGGGQLGGESAAGSAPRIGSALMP